MTTTTDAGARALRDAGLRSTRQRLLLLERLRDRDDAVTAQDLHAELRGEGERVGLTTVYRTLTSLAEAGLLDTFSRDAEQAFRLCSDSHHHHLVCDTCHRVVEVEADLVEEWVGRVGERHDFAVHAHRVEVHGLCTDCRDEAAGRR